METSERDREIHTNDSYTVSIHTEREILTLTSGCTPGFQTRLRLPGTPSQFLLHPHAYHIVLCIRENARATNTFTNAMELKERVRVTMPLYIHTTPGVVA